MIYFLIGGVLILLSLGYFLKISARKLAIEGLPEGKIVFEGIHFKGSKILQSPSHFLKGTPDYVIRENDEYIPVEIKSSKTPQRIYKSDRMQTVAYALLIKAEFGKLPSYAVVKYPERAFDIKITKSDIEQVDKAIAIMRSAIITGQLESMPKPRHLCSTCSITKCPYR